NSSCGAGEHGGVTCHRLEVDNTEWLVDGGTTKNACTAVQLNRLMLRDHLLDPDDMGLVAACLFDLLPHLRCNVLSIWCSSAKHYLRFLRQVANCIHEMGHALLSSDAAHEQDIWLRWIDPIIG